MKFPITTGAVIGTVLAGAMVFGLSACQSYDDHRGKGDAPVGKGDDSPAAITNMPDGFPNIAVKCIKGHQPWAVTVTTDRVPIMFQDPANCGGKVVVGSLTAEGN